MKKTEKDYILTVEAKNTVCPLGETVGKEMIEHGRIPVISCEGGCFRGEIARQAAHLVAKNEPYMRGCHGEMFTAPASAMAAWAKTAESIVVIDGCFMHCHGRIMRNLVGEGRVIQFDALPMYNRAGQYADVMLYDDVPETERMDLARQVAQRVLGALSGAESAGVAVEGGGCGSGG